LRVIECSFCGETLSAANDDELVKAAQKHVGERHPQESLDDSQVREQAYDASDS
jgi:hypothetical protein